MFCTKCGKKLDDASKFCTSCGAPVSNVVNNMTETSQSIVSDKSQIEHTIGSENRTHTGTDDAANVEKHRLAKPSLILGIIGAAISFIFMVSIDAFYYEAGFFLAPIFTSLPLIVLGIVFGIVSLTKSKVKKTSIAGISVSAGGFLFLIIFWATIY